MQEKNVKTRAEMAEEYTWNLAEMYETDEAWEKEYRSVKEALPKLEVYQGKIGESAKGLADCLRLRDAIGERLGKLYVYAFMRYHENTGNTRYQALSDRIAALNVEADSAFSFIVPEIIALPTEKIDQYIQEESSLALYDFHLKQIMRQKDHILSVSEEKLIAQMGEVANTPEHAFGLLTNADLKFPEITDEEGQQVRLTEERYSKFIYAQDRRVRKEAFQALFTTYRSMQNTIGALYSGSVKKDVFYAKVRHYDSALAEALDGDHIPVVVYDTVIDTVNENLAPLHRYMALRKKMLGVDALHMYDLYTPLVPELQKEISYQEAQEMVLAGLEPLGEDYQVLLKKALAERWIDVYENEGKRSGAYSWGTYGTNPYMLLNYGDTFQDVFTVAHELGHSLHSYQSWTHQPYLYSGYTIFLAEVASTTNEALLMQHLLKKTTDKKEKMYLLNHYLEKIRTTVYRQTLFAEFEKVVHGKAEAGEPLTPDLLCQIWHDLNIKYYGPDVVVDEEVDIEWARIPHFYSAFYVYKYVTGYAAATSLSEQILSGDPSATERYLAFLQQGSSAYSLDILQAAGVDMTTAQPLRDTIAVFVRVLEELESLV